ncbi:hypothetical protein [Streptomyces sp. NPDC013455]|uniref:hypothetical protein n=1 Tax=Streptomyces sp. NPDC013455 TaxID=3155605 RepID=UPI00340219DB
MSDDDQQQLTPRRGKVLKALARAEQGLFTRPAPNPRRLKWNRFSRGAGVNQGPAERLGVSRRTVDRYRAGQLTIPQKYLRAALVEETESLWQPQIKAHARPQAARSGDAIPPGRKGPGSRFSTEEVPARLGWAWEPREVTPAGHGDRRVRPAFQRLAVDPPPAD